MSGSQSALYGGGKTPRFEEFKTSGTFTPSQRLLDAGGVVEYELSGSGGGGGGSTNSGGGGGSSKQYGVLVVTGPIAITIAASAPPKTNGSASSIGPVTCPGGGAGSGAAGGAPGGRNGRPGANAITSGGYDGVGGGDGGGASPNGAGVPNSGGGGGGAPTGGGGGGPGGSGYAMLKWWE